MRIAMKVLYYLLAYSISITVGSIYTPRIAVPLTIYRELINKSTTYYSQVAEQVYGIGEGQNVSVSGGPAMIKITLKNYVS